MRRTLILAAIAFLLITVSLGYFTWLKSSQAEQKQVAEDAKTKRQPNLVAAPGVVESASEEIEVGAEIPGKLRAVLVEEGDVVTENQIIAVLENADFAAQVLSAKTQIETLRRQQNTARARLSEAEADKLRLKNGARIEERKAAFAAYEQTLPIIENAQKEIERRRRLYEKGDVSREEFDRASRDLAVANKRATEMRERFDFVNAAAREDELDKADASIQLATAQIQEFDALVAEAAARVKVAEANLAKTVVRAPVSGVVLRKRLKNGESVSPENSNTGIVTIGDVSTLRVRVDVDERDVAKIKENQFAYVTADAFGAQKFTGKVVKIGQILGRKNVRTERPTERVDTKILEVLIELDRNQRLPLNLRVDAFIEE